MPKFTYKAKNASGDEYEKTLEAVDRFSVYDAIRAEGGSVISVREVKKGSLRERLNFNAVSAFLSTVSTDEKVVFARNLSAMSKAGLPLSRSLVISMRQTNNPKLVAVIRSLSNDISNGTPFHQALEKFPRVFSRLFVAMIKAGEESGGLAEALLTLARQMERTSTLKKKIRGALIYPAIIILVMIIITFLMMIYVVPTLTTTFVELGIELPATTQVIIDTSTFVSTNVALTLLLLVLIPASFVWFVRTTFGRRVYDTSIVHLPIIGELVKETNSARTTRTLSSLLSAGVDVISALSITGEVVQNFHYKNVLKDAEKNVQKGAPLSKAFNENEHLYPVLVGEMIAVGEETGQIASMLLEVADFYEGEVEQKTKDMSTIIEPFLIVLIGGGVGFFALAMIAPIYSISDSIG